MIQRFGSALNLNIHFHILFLDGVYVFRDTRPPRFQRIKAPNKDELEDLVQLISQRVGGRCLVPPTRAPPERLPLFAWEESASSRFNQ
ncbi:transposase [Parahaliea mediterranea]|uniref:transposase n=1 Tax=Parahaliea mediterranea TaxID=651086 RepID=UPI003D666740